MIMDMPEIMTRREVADLLRVSEASLSRWARSRTRSALPLALPDGAAISA
jgi:hypothetical protein